MYSILCTNIDAIQCDGIECIHTRIVNEYNGIRIHGSDSTNVNVGIHNCILGILCLNANIVVLHLHAYGPYLYLSLLYACIVYIAHPHMCISVYGYSYT